jgi:hypothetical protein
VYGRERVRFNDNAYGILGTDVGRIFGVGRSKDVGWEGHDIEQGSSVG